MEEIKKETFNKLGERAQEHTSGKPTPPLEPADEGIGIESNATITLDYGRIRTASGEAYLFEKILLCCYQCLNNNSNVLDIRKLCDWFSKNWNIQLTYEAATFYTLFPSNIKFKPTFNQRTFTTSSNVPDSKLPGEMKDFANEYADIKSMLGYSPSALKRACIFLIASLTDRVYSNAKYIDIRERNIILDRILNFLQTLQVGQAFAFLREGKNFKQYLQPVITTLTENLDEVKSIINQPKQIPIWLRDYLEHAKNIIDGLPLYTHYMLQGIDIKISAIKYALEEIYKKYINIISGEEIPISLTRAKDIKKYLDQVILIVKTHLPEKENISLEDIRALVTNKIINVTQAGFYIDYVLNQYDAIQRLEQAAQGKLVFHLSADQFLRELIHNSLFCQATFIDALVKEGLDYYSKLSANKETLEYSLTLLRQHVLRTDKTMKTAADDRKHQGNPTQYLELAGRALKPQLIDFSSNSDLHLTNWAPGVFSVFQQDSKNKTVQNAAKEYFQLLCLLTAINQELAAYSWFVQTLEKACFSNGSLQVTILHRKFLMNLSQRTLDSPLRVIKKALFEFRNRKRESAKEVLVAEAMRINKPNASKWASIGLDVSKKDFFTKMVTSISALEHVCRSLEDYVNDKEIKRHIDQISEIDRILDMAATIVMPDAKEYMQEARRFGEDARNRLNDFLSPKTDLSISTPEKKTTPLDDKKEEHPVPRVLVDPSSAPMTPDFKRAQLPDVPLMSDEPGVDLILHQAENILEAGIISAAEFERFVKNLNTPEKTTQVLAVFLPVACHFCKTIPLEWTPEIISNFERISIVLHHARNLLPPKIGLEAAELASSMIELCQSKGQTPCINLYEALQNLRKKIEFLPPVGVLSKTSWFAQPVKTTKSIEGEKRLLKTLADLCVNSKGVLDLTIDSLAYKKFFRLSDDLLTDQAKYNCVISLLNATEASLASMQADELPDLSGVIALTYKLLTKDNIFFINRPQLFESLQDQFTILDATLKLLKPSQVQPDDIKQIVNIFQNIFLELSSVYVPDAKALYKSNDLINKSCDAYINKYKLKPPASGTVLALRNSADKELHSSSVHKLFSLFEKNKRFVYNIIYAHTLANSLVSNYYLQDERMCLVNHMIAKVSDTSYEHCRTESQPAMHRKFQRQIKKIFCFFMMDNTQIPEQDQFLVAETCRRLNNSFGIQAKFNFDKNCYEPIVDKEKKYTAPQIGQEAAEMLLFMLNTLRRIDREIIAKLPKIYNKHEEQQSDFYFQFKQEVELVNSYGATPPETKTIRST